MFEIKNLNKTYQTKYCRVEALKDISFKLPNQGMVFIVGKSGCGKSTLLNVLGGLDKFDCGDIRCNNQSLSSFSLKDFDHYRNNYVGFVFQDYSLIPNLTVFDNINLPLALIKDNDDQKVLNILEKVQLSGLEKRYPHELSGGQQQRVAIARALVKDPQIILADEPTGNLDSKTSEEIFKLLKEISLTKLVVIVSHDRQAASLYADQIIELKDGKLLSDRVQNQFVPLYESFQNSEFSHGRLSYKSALNISFANIRNKLGRSLITLILFVLAMIVCLQVLTFLLYNRVDALTKTVTNNNIEYLHFYNADEDQFFIRGGLINREVGNKILSKTTYPSRSTKYINSINDLKEFGYTFYEGATEINDDGAIVSDYFIDNIIYQSYNSWGSTYYILIPGEGKKQLDSKYKDYQFLIGKTIYEYYYGNINPIKQFQIAAIYKTDYKDFFNNDFTYKAKANENLWNLKYQSLYKFFTTPNFEYIENRYLYQELKLDFFSELDYHFSIRNSEGNDLLLTSSFRILDEKQIFSDYNPIIITKNGLVNEEDLVLLENEAIINVDLYNLVFNENYTKSYFYEDGNLINNPILDFTISYQVYDDVLNKELIVQDLKVIGLKLSTNSYIANPNLYMKEPSRKFDIISEENFTYISVYIGNNRHDVRNLIQEYSTYGLYPVFDLYEEFYAQEGKIYSLTIIFILIGGLLLIVTFFMITNQIIMRTKKNKREIGILKSLGCSNADINKIYIFEAYIISTLTFIITMILLPLIIFYANFSIKEQFTNLHYFTFNPLTVLFVFLMVYVIPLFAIIITVWRINRLKPIEAIKNLK